MSHDWPILNPARPLLLKDAPRGRADAAVAPQLETPDQVGYIQT
jgi:hypothetical protein